jgi:hypothetical protein
MDSFYTSRLSSLRSQEQVDLLDEIDALSRSGLREHVSLPQIAVCGDQSRFATELILRLSSGGKLFLIRKGQQASGKSFQNSHMLLKDLVSFQI